MTIAAPVALEDLLRQLESLPVQRSAALQVVRLAADPDCGAPVLGRAAAEDPVLAAQLLRMANSSMYGLASKVTNLQMAVVVLGSGVVRGVAASAATRSGTGTLPPGFWQHAACTASASALLARNVGARRDDAFCAGILHEIGSALLERLDPQGHSALVASEMAAGRNPLVAERERYGTDHATAAARVLTAWEFPQDLCDAVAGHHGMVPPDAPLTLALRAGRVLASRVPGVETHDPADAWDDLLSDAGVEDADDLLQRVERDAGALAGALSGV